MRSAIAATDVFAGDFLEDAGTAVVKLKVDGRFLRLAVKARLRIVEIFTRKDHAALDQNRTSVTVSEAFVAKGTVPCAS